MRYSQFTCGLIFIPTPAAKFLSWDRNVNSIDQTPFPPSDLKKGRSLTRETKTVIALHNAIRRHEKTQRVQEVTSIEKK